MPISISGQQRYLGGSNTALREVSTGQTETRTAPASLHRLKTDSFSKCISPSFGANTPIRWERQEAYNKKSDLLKTGTMVAAYLRNHRIFLPGLSMNGLSSSFFNGEFEPSSMWFGSGVLLEKTDEISQGTPLLGFASVLAQLELLRRDLKFQNVTWTIGDADAKEVHPEAAEKIQLLTNQQATMLRAAVKSLGLEERYRILPSSELGQLSDELRQKEGYESQYGFGDLDNLIEEILREDCERWFNLKEISAISDRVMREKAKQKADAQVGYAKKQISDMLFATLAENSSGRLGWAVEDSPEIKVGNWDERTFDALFRIVCEKLQSRHGISILRNNHYSFFYGRAETFPGKANACPYSVSSGDLKHRLLMTDNRVELAKKVWAYIHTAQETKNGHRTAQAKESINTLKYIQDVVWLFQQAFPYKGVLDRNLKPEDLRLIYFDKAHGNQLIINGDAIIFALLDIKYLFNPQLEDAPGRREFTRKDMGPPPVKASELSSWATDTLFPPVTYGDTDINLPANLTNEESNFYSYLAAWSKLQAPLEKADIEIRIMEGCSNYFRALTYADRQKILADLKIQGLTKAFDYFNCLEKARQANAASFLASIDDETIVEDGSQIYEESAKLVLESARFHYWRNIWDITEDAEAKGAIQDNIIEQCPNYLKSISPRHRTIVLQDLRKSGMTKVLKFFESQIRSPETFQEQKKLFRRLLSLWDDPSQTQMSREQIEQSIIKDCLLYLSSSDKILERALKVLHKKGINTALEFYRQKYAPVEFQQELFEQLLSDWDRATGHQEKIAIEARMVTECQEYIRSLLTLPGDVRGEKFFAFRERGLHQVIEFYRQMRLDYNVQRGNLALAV